MTFVKNTKKKTKTRNWKEQEEFQKEKRKSHRPKHQRVDPWIEAVEDKFYEEY